MISDAEQASEMATEILNGPVTGPYLADDGDIIVVADDAVLRSNAYNTGAIQNRTLADDGISIVVDGKVRSTNAYGDGIRLIGPLDYGNYPSYSDNQIQVRDGGFVRGYVGIQLFYGQDNIISVSGRVVGEYAGINVEEGHAWISNSGTVRATFSAAVTFIGSEGSTIINTGRLLGGGGGIWMQAADGMAITNSGRVEGGDTGIGVVDTKGMSIINSGKVVATGENGAGIDLKWADGFDVRNTGTISGNLGLSSELAAGYIDNSGSIIGQSVAIRIGGDNDPTGGVVIHNTGDIRGEQSLYAFDGKIDVTNQGVMVGDIDAILATTMTLTNSGRIVGAVRLGDLNDVYRGEGGGEVTRFINGGGGQDRLFGADYADDLRGDDGNDKLRGRGGDDMLDGGGGQDLIRGGAGDDTIDGGGQNDTLKGGRGDDALAGRGGDDRLSGGAGNDALTGGTGADVFVFGPGRGRDTVTDFQDDTDTIELAQTLWGGGLTVAEVINTYANVIGPDTVFDFGGGDVLVLEGFSATGLLGNDLLLV